MALREISGYVCFLSTTAPSPNLFMSPRLSLIISVCFPPFVSCCSLSLSLSLHAQTNDRTFLSSIQDDSPLMQSMLFCRMSFLSVSILFSPSLPAFFIFFLFNRQSYQPSSCYMMNTNLMMDRVHHFAMLSTPLGLCMGCYCVYKCGCLDVCVRLVKKGTKRLCVIL